MAPEIKDFPIKKALDFSQTPGQDYNPIYTFTFLGQSAAAGGAAVELATSFNISPVTWMQVRKIKLFGYKIPNIAGVKTPCDFSQVLMTFGSSRSPISVPEQFASGALPADPLNSYWSFGPSSNEIQTNLLIPPSPTLGSPVVIELRGFGNYAINDTIVFHFFMEWTRLKA